MKVSILTPHRLAGAVGHIEGTQGPYVYVRVSTKHADPHTLHAIGTLLDDQSYGLWVLKGDTQEMPQGFIQEICDQLKELRPGLWCGQPYIAEKGQDRAESTHMRCVTEQTCEIEGDQIVYRGTIWTKDLLYKVAYAVLVPDTLLYPIIDAIYADGTWILKERP